MGRAVFPPVQDFLPKRKSLATLRAAVQTCRACPLYRDATQGVFGEGPGSAAMMLVGEQPGNQEDLSGRPFVGPAGKVLDAALAEAGVRRSAVYVTNAVKHFKFVQRGPARIHKTPGELEVSACLPWLEEEVALVEPAVIVCLGATAARALVGPQARVQRDHGKSFATRWSAHTVVTYHPSALLRATDSASRETLRGTFVADLAAAARWLSLARGRSRA